VISKEALDALLAQPDPYPTRGPIPTGTGPGSESFVKTPPFVHPIERNVHVGGLWVSICLCPQCGQKYAHEGLLNDNEPDPPCWRCEVSVGVPLDPDEAAAMAEFRWRYDRFLAAVDIGSGKSQEEMRHLFVTACDSGMVYAPPMLKALERRYGNQVDAGVQAILNGASGVEM